MIHGRYNGRPSRYSYHVTFAEAQTAPVLWRDALREASVHRAIWIDHVADLEVADSAPDVKQIFTEGRDHAELAEHVADLNDLQPET